MNESAYLMLELINQEQFLGPDTRVKLVEQDTACSGDAGLKATSELLMQRPEDRPFGIVGCGCSGCTMMATQVARVGMLPLVSHSASNQILSKRDVYPNFFRMQAPDGPVIVVWFTVFHALGWKKFAHFYNMEWGFNMLDIYEANMEYYGDAMQDVLAGTEMQVIRESSQQAAGILLDKIVQEKVRGIMSNAYATETRQLTCRMIKTGVKGMVIAHFGWFSPVWWTLPEEGADCSAESMDAQSEFFISAMPIFWPKDLSGTLTCSPTTTQQWFRNEYLSRIAAIGAEERPEAAPTADAVCMLALLYKEMLADGYTIQELHGMSPATYADALARMQAMEFDGVSGLVSFPADPTAYSAGDRVQEFEFLQKVGGIYSSVGSEFKRTLQLYDGKTLVFADGKSLDDPPSALFPSCPSGEKYDFLSDTCVSCPEYFGYDDVLETCFLLCPPGRVPNNEATSCDRCPAGTAKTEFGSAPCGTCLPGYFAAAEGATECAWCPLGRYAKLGGSQECDPCDAGLTTDEVGSISPNLCVCDEGTYMPAATGAGCSPCPQGMACAVGSDERFIFNASLGPSPVVFKGYMTLEAEPLQVYRCLHQKHCPGGPPGKCAPYRDPNAVACGHCEDGAHESGEECVPCKGSSSLLFFCVFILAIALLAGMTYFVNKDIVKQTHGNLRVVVLVGLTVTSIQTMGAFKSLTLDWFQPLASLLDVLTIISFNIKVLNMGCVVRANAITIYMCRQLVAPVSLPLILVLLFCKKRVIHSETAIKTQFVNTAASVFNIFFISITTSGLAPLVCYNHPGDSGSSVLTDPSILCFDSSDHTIMVVIGVIAMLVVPIPFFSVTCWATAVYPKYVGARNMDFVKAFQSIFFRFRPDKYYYAVVMICRSFLVCLVPVIFRSDTAFQIFMMCAVIGFWVIVQQTIQPWTGTSTNVIDGAASMMLILLLITGGLGSPSALETDVIKVLGTVTFVSFLVLAVIALVVATYQKFKPKPFYDCFVCHHKRDAAAQARFVKNALEVRESLAVFIDSDDLIDLGTLFDTVKWRISRLVVYLTRDTLRRPWCAGEIATAFSASRASVTAIVTPSFQAPTSQMLTDLNDYLDLDDCKLTSFGITDGQVRYGFMKLTDPETPRIELNTSLLGTTRLDLVVSSLGSGKADHKDQEQQTFELPLTAGMLAISCEPNNDEAIAAAGTLLLKTTGAVFTLAAGGICVMANYKPDLDRIATLVSRSRAVIIFLSSGTLSSNEQLIAIDELMALKHSAAEASATGAMVNNNTESAVGETLPMVKDTKSLIGHLSSNAKEKADDIPVPVLVNLPGFEFPTPATWATMSPALQSVLKLLFSLISAPFSISASDATLETQAQEILRRARLTRNFSPDVNKSAKGALQRLSQLAMAPAEPDPFKDVLLRHFELAQM